MPVNTEPLDLVLARLEGVTARSGYHMARCPAHDDREASLSITAGRDQPVVLKCHAGCEFQAILDALGLSTEEVGNERGRDDNWTPAGPATDTYIYTSASGTPLFGVTRTADKQFRQFRPDPAQRSGRSWSVKGVTLVPYQLPRVLAAVDAGETVHIAEGEKDVHALMAEGVTATCNPMGAGKWLDRYSAYFRGAEVVIIADNDDPGIEHALKVASSLGSTAASVKIVGARAGKDASDHLAAGYGIWEFRELEAADPVAPGQPVPGINVTQADGAPILDDTEAAYLRFVAFGSEHQAVAMALWTMHTHAIDAADTTPYMDISSPEPESGKTRVLEVAELLVARPWMLIEPSEAALFRMISSEKPTILHDEYDATFGRKADSREGLRAILNAGYRRGGTVPRCVGEQMQVQHFEVFGAKALAGLSGKLPRTVATRCIPVKIQRRKPSQQVERFRQRDALGELTPLRDRLASWGELMCNELRSARPSIPTSLSDRQADCWEPLLAMADAAGGSWPSRARAAAVSLHGRDGDAGESVLLLAHIAEAFADAGAEWLSTASLLLTLVQRDDGPWATWWENDMAASAHE
jgi:hypothetical protein